MGHRAGQFVSKWTLIGGGGFTTATGASPGEGLKPVFEIPTGTLDGSNTVFYLSYAPLDNWLVLMLDNALQNPAVDFSLSGKQITYAVAPQPGDAQAAWYFVKNLVPLASPVTMASAVGQGKVLNIGSSSPPSDWSTVGYSDSAWSAAVAGNPTGPAVPGSAWISHTSLAGTGYGTDLIRQHFTLPSGTPASCSLTITCDDWPDEVWINGVLVWNPADTGGTMIPSQTISIPVSTLVTGDNVFALRLKDNLPFYISTSYVLSVS